MEISLIGLNDFQDSLIYILVFFIYGGGAVVALVIAIKDVANRREKLNQYIKWTIVFLLCIAQVGCWNVMNEFGAAFSGGGDGIGHLAIPFLLLIGAWFVYTIFRHVKTLEREALNRQSNPEHRKPTPSSEQNVKVTFSKLIQDSEDFGSNDELIVSRIYFSVEPEETAPENAYVDVFQPASASSRSANPRLSEVVGYSGVFDTPTFKTAVMDYYRSLVGNEGPGIRIATGGFLRLRNKSAEKTKEVWLKVII